jgi:hypothetical protein
MVDVVALGVILIETEKIQSGISDHFCKKDSKAPIVYELIQYWQQLRYRLFITLDTTSFSYDRKS